MTKYIFLFIIMFSFSSKAQTDNEHGKESEKNITDFTFFDPIYNHKNQKKIKTVYDRYEKNTSYTLDSLFSVESKKYRIYEKLRYKKSKISNEIEDEIKLVFSFAKKNKYDFSISPKLKSVISKTNNRYGIFISINPKGGSSPYTGRPTINKTSIEIIIFDLTKHQIVFYDKSKALKTFNVGFRKTLIKNLNHIYKKIEKL